MMFCNRWVGLSALTVIVFLTVSSAAVASTDALNTNLTLCVALAKVERALICREGNGVADRNAILRTLGEYDRLGGYPAWARIGLKADAEGKMDLAARLAHALLMKTAGDLYGFPMYSRRGRTLVAECRRLAGGTVSFRDESSLPDAVRAYYRIMEESREDMTHVIRRGGQDGQPFWNGNARLFCYPPSFEFTCVDGAASYRYRVMDDVQTVRMFTDPTPTATLEAVWPELPIGFTTVFCEALDASGRVLGSAGVRRFWRSAAFDPAEYRPAPRTYSDGYRMVVDYLFSTPEIAELERNGKPDIAVKSNFTSYPSKMQSSVIQMMVDLARVYPERRERALRVARCSADYLISTAQPPDAPLAYFPATYVGEGQLSGTYGGQQMLVYPADAGRSLVKLARAADEPRYLAFAKNIAQTYMRLQGDDGSWYLKMYEKDGSPVSKNRLVPISVIAFMEDLYAATGDKTYRTVADRAFASIDRGPLASWDWEGQFEDIRPSAARYQNLTKHNACDTAMYLLKRFPGDATRVKQARDILRFAEDQFVVWRSPCRSDGTGAWNPIYPFYAWRTPAVLEQYTCYSPIDASAAKLIRTCLALYRAEGRALDLAKARALGDSMLNNQDANGRIRTYWIPEAEDADEPLAGAIRLPLGGDWYNCMVADAVALSLLAELE